MKKVGEITQLFEHSARSHDYIWQRGPRVGELARYLKQPLFSMIDADSFEFGSYTG